jgi:hypothetical protein
LIQIKFVDHSLSATYESAQEPSTSHSAQLLVVQVLLQLFRYSPQVSNGDLARLIVIKESEGLADFLQRVSGQYSLRHCEDTALKRILSEQFETH